MAYMREAVRAFAGATGAIQRASVLRKASNTAAPPTDLVSIDPGAAQRLGLAFFGELGPIKAKPLDEIGSAHVFDAAAVDLHLQLQSGRAAFDGGFDRLDHDLGMRAAVIDRG